MCSYILYLYKQTIRFIVQRESRSKSGSGEWPARAVVGAPRVTIEVVGSRFPSSPLTSALPELWYRPHPWRICHWSKGAVVWRVGAMKLVVWSMVVLFLGGGGSYSSFAAGSCLRGVEASSAPPSSVLYPGCEGSFNLASPAFWWASSFDRLWIMWVVLVSTEAFRSSELRRNEFCGEADPAMFPNGDGRVETEEMRVAPTVLIITRIRSPRRVDQPKSSGSSWFGFGSQAH
ncbi:hypothetical protein Bca4012_046715 [Brassica carinata]